MFISKVNVNVGVYIVDSSPHSSTDITSYTVQYDGLNVLHGVERRNLPTTCI